MNKQKSIVEKRGFSISNSNISMDWSLLVIIFGIWAYVICRYYFQNHPVDLSQIGLFFHLEIGKITKGRLLLLLNYLSTTVLLLAILISAFWVGSKLFKGLKFYFSFLLEELIFSIGLGFVIFAYGTLLLGLLGLLYKSLFYGLLIVFSFFGVREINKLWKMDKYVARKIWPLKCKSYFWTYTFGLVLLALVFINFCMAFLPELFYDALVYHLGCANYYVVKHKIISMPYNRFGYMPLSMSMLYAICLLLQGTSLARLLHFAAGVLTLIATLSFSKRFFKNYSIGLLGGIFFYYAPFVAMHSWTGGNDLALAFTHSLAVYALLLWFDSNDDAQAKKWLVASAVFAGFTASIKYSSGFCLFPVPFLIIWNFFLKNKEKFLKVFMKVYLYLGIVIAVLSPWLIRSWVGTGNPIYPFFDRWLVKEERVATSDITEITDEYPIFGKLLGGKGATPGEKEYEIKISSLINLSKKILKMPWNLTIKGTSSYTFVGPLFLLFMPFVFLVKRKEKIIITLLWYFLLSFVFWGVFTDRFKYYIPAIPLMGIVTAYTIDSIGRSIPKYLERTFFIFILILLGTILYSLLGIIKFTYSPFKVLTGLESQDNYLSFTRPGYPNPSYVAIKYINNNLPRTSKILFIGEAKIHYIERDFIANTVDNRTPIIEWARSSDDGDALYKEFRKNGITHILLNLREAIRTSNFGIFYWKERDLKILGEFWDKYLRQIYVSANNVFLYELMSEEEASIAHKGPFNFLAELNKYNYKPESLLDIFMKNEMWDYAINEYKEYARFGYNVYSQLGYLFFRKADFREAIRMYEMAIEREHNLANLAQGYASLSQLYGALGENERAIQAIIEALKIDPQNRTYQTIYNRLKIEKK